MNSDKYNDGVLDEKFNNLAHQLTQKDQADAERFEAQNKILNAIAEQTTKTNGRVGYLEGWRQYVVGAITMLTVVIIPALGFLAYMVIQTSNHVSAIEAIINQLTSHESRLPTN